MDPWTVGLIAGAIVLALGIKRGSVRADPPSPVPGPVTPQGSLPERGQVQRAASGTEDSEDQDQDQTGSASFSRSQAAVSTMAYADVAGGHGSYGGGTGTKSGTGTGDVVGTGPGGFDVADQSPIDAPQVVGSGPGGFDVSEAPAGPVFRSATTKGK